MLIQFKKDGITKEKKLCTFKHMVSQSVVLIDNIHLVKVVLLSYVRTNNLTCKIKPMMRQGYIYIISYRQKI